MSVLTQLIAAIYKSSAPPPPLGNQTFAYTGYVESFTVPTGVTSLNVNMWGAGGGSGGNGSGADSRGGAGGFVKFTTAVTAGETLTAQVGGGGAKGSTSRRPGTAGGMTSIVRGDPFYSDVTLLLPMNGTNGSTTFTDSSTNPKTFTVVGTAQISTSVTKYGTGSLYLPATTDGIYTTGLNLNLDFTIEGWVKPSISGSEKFMISQGINQSNGFLIALTTTEIRWRSNGTQDIYATISQPDWYHFAIVRNGSGTNNIKVYVNGTQVTQGSYVNSITSAAGNLYVGNGGLLSSGSASYGYIDDFRITNDVARYIANFTAPTSEFPNPLDQYFDNVSLLLHMNGTNGSTTFTDSSKNNITVTPNGSAQISTAESKFGGGSLFTGTSGSNFLQIPASNDFIFGTGNFTVEGWFNPTGSGDDRTFYIHGINTSGGLSLFVGTNGTRFRANGTTDLTAGASITTWTHIAFVRSGNTRYIFINGALANSDSLSFDVSDNVVTDIGASSQNGSDSFKYYGYIDELRITKGVARYTAAFNPPNREFPNSNGIIAIVGAGGGGGGYGSTNTYSWGGSGGDTTANPGGDAYIYSTGGGAGTPTAGGAAGTPGVGLAGSYLQGGAGAGYTLGTQVLGGWPNGGNAVNIDERGGGGGGGYYGGGGGGGEGTWGAGGGGGSSYTGTSVTAITHAKATQNTVTAPGNTESGYVASVATGGENFNNGGNGLIYISW